jgi:hypothetical protein
VEYVDCYPWAMFTHKLISRMKRKKTYLCRWVSPLIAPWPSLSMYQREKEELEDVRYDMSCRDSMSIEGGRQCG